MLRDLLEIPSLYRLLARCFNTDSAHRQLLTRIGYAPGLRVLDVGCGPGDLARYFEPSDYVGIDVSEEYIQHARRNHGGTFHSLPAERIGELTGPFDLTVMFGVFHHLSDESVRKTLEGLAQLLKRQGRFVLMEAVWPSYRWDLPGYVLRKLDRGQFVRTRAQWCRLLGETWQVQEPFLLRNFAIEYFGCTLRPPICLPARAGREQAA